MSNKELNKWVFNMLLVAPPTFLRQRIFAEVTADVVKLLTIS